MSNYPTETNHNHFHYNIEHVRQRFIPTYYHDQLFSQQQPTNNTVRCTPTYHSTALNVQGYSPTINQHLKHNQLNKQQQHTSTYNNTTKQLRQKELNPDSHCCLGNSKVDWYDNAKNDLFANMRCSSARERKIADLSSNPVFGGNFFVPNNNTAQSQHYKQIQTNAQLEVKQQLDNIRQQVRQQEKALIQTHQEVVNNDKNSQKHGQIIEPQSLRNNNTQITKEMHQLIQNEVQKQLIQRDTNGQNPQKAVSQPKGKTTVANKQKLPIERKQQFNLNNEVTFGKKKDTIGRKLNKSVVVGAVKPTFTVVRNR